MAISAPSSRRTWRCAWARGAKDGTAGEIADELEGAPPCAPLVVACTSDAGPAAIAVSVPPSAWDVARPGGLLLNKTIFKSGQVIVSYTPTRTGMCGSTQFRYVDKATLESMAFRVGEVRAAGRSCVAFLTPEREPSATTKEYMLEALYADRADESPDWSCVDVFTVDGAAAPSGPPSVGGDTTAWPYWWDDAYVGVEGRWTVGVAPPRPGLECIRVWSSRPKSPGAPEDEFSCLRRGGVSPDRQIFIVHSTSYGNGRMGGIPHDAKRFWISGIDAAGNASPVRELQPFPYRPASGP